MAWSSGSLSRSLLSTGSSSPIRRSSSSASSLPGLLRPPVPPRPHRRPIFSTARTMAGEMGCIQSLVPLHSALAVARLTSHISIQARAFCELSQGT